MKYKIDLHEKNWAWRYNYRKKSILRRPIRYKSIYRYRYDVAII